ncbi:flagellar FlbD family protein [Bacillus coahuilensis]|uniref:flagellar FlbD family protein n=1 Tax=Bacillus coahuilensis TaxID=408580 RepID=UPI0001850C90|nr:flagellar FlbD family protein [Bacillus coahuilensis]
MIEVTRLNGTSFHLNAAYIETIEALPDTTILLTNGRKYVVRESEEDILNKVESFYLKTPFFNTVKVRDEGE